jgi:hypothetical protein
LRSRAAPPPAGYPQRAPPSKLNLAGARRHTFLRTLTWAQSSDARTSAHHVEAAGLGWTSSSIIASSAQLGVDRVIGAVAPRTVQSRNLSAEELRRTSRVQSSCSWRYRAHRHLAAQEVQGTAHARHRAGPELARRP